jgi:hypothetical protein
VTDPRQPTTEAGRRLDADIYGVPRVAGDYTQDILAIEQQARAAALAEVQWFLDHNPNATDRDLVEGVRLLVRPVS